MDSSLPLLQPENDSGDGSTGGSDAVFLNRELSWIDFNERVLGEGLRRDLPPLERFKFLSIVSSNYDEFFMVRVASIKRAREAGNTADLSGLSPSELLKKISIKTRLFMERHYNALVNEVFPGLEKGGMRLLRPDEWSNKQRDYLESFFTAEILPLLTPLRFEEEGPLPSIESHCLYAAFLLENESGQEPAEEEARGVETEADSSPAEYISIVRVPESPARVIWLPAEESASEKKGQVYWALLEDLIQTWGGSLYPGYTIKESILFKVNRDADFSVDEKRDEDFIEAMEEVLEDREKSRLIRMISSPGSKKIRDFLARRFSLDEDDLFETAGPINLGNIYERLQARSGFDHLKEKPWKIYSHPAFSTIGLPNDQSIWDRIKTGDVILHHPYQSFDPVVRFFQEAAADPHVVAIKTALYRTSGDSPIVRSLEQASLSGKHVTAVVELKARFDEERNISWANRLEKAGVIVVYGLARLKIHAKVSIVMRREYDRMKRYVHLSTGNYNDKTAKLYEDISLFTAREDIAYDAGLLFNMITGYSTVQSMSKLVIAPTALKRRLLDLFVREVARSSPEAPGKIVAKMNSLADPDIIWTLYRASQAGVKIYLVVRGVCMLVPGVKGLSENIRVVSVIDRYLEHSRIYYFANGGSEELYLASADLMPRNLERRVELMFPVLAEDSRRMLFEGLSAYFRDNSQAWLLNSDGNWNRVDPALDEKPFRVQAYFHSNAANAAQAEIHPDATEFIVRRSPAQ